VDPDEGVQEQAFNVIRNLAENEEGIDMVFRELGAEVLMIHLEMTLQSSKEDVVLQVSVPLSLSCTILNLPPNTGCIPPRQPIKRHPNAPIAHPQLPRHPHHTENVLGRVEDGDQEADGGVCFF
jgi:hypothetical protein